MPTGLLETDRNSAIRLQTVSADLPADIVVLRDESGAEGFHHVARLIDDWEAGRQRFTRPGERLLVAEDGTRTVAVGGLTHDPYLPGALRMRRFYVAPAARRTGIGRCLAERLLAGTPPDVPITANAPDGQAAAFWRSLGFKAAEAEHHNLIRPAAAK